MNSPPSTHRAQLPPIAPGRATPTPCAAPWRTTQLRNLVAFLLFSKVALLGFILLEHQSTPGLLNLDQLTKHTLPHREGPLLGEFAWRTLATWDAQYYLAIAERGYTSLPEAARAFYPLWPLVIRATAPFVGGDFLLAALLVSNLCSLIGFLLFYRLLCKQTDDEQADLALLLLLAFPTGFFFLLPYSESLFFLLLMLVWWSVTKNRYGLGITVGLLLALTRPVGVLVSVPLFVSWWQRREAGALALALSPLLGFGIYLFCSALLWDDPFAGMHAARLFEPQGGVSRLFEPLGFIKSLFGPVYLHSFTNSALDRLFFLACAVISLQFGRRNPFLLAMMVALGILPAILNQFAAYERYLLVCFPFFIALSQLLRAKCSRYQGALLILIFILLQGFFLLRHTGWNWAA